MESAPARAQSHIPPFVPTHIMPRAALKRLNSDRIATECLVPTHTMLRAALKHVTHGAHPFLSCPDTHNAACGIETGCA